MKNKQRQTEYERNMGEFREILSRFGHNVKHRLENPRFISNDTQPQTGRKTSTKKN